jgi:hypothetical protein
MRNAYTVSVGKPEGKKQLGKSRRRGTAWYWPPAGTSELDNEPLDLVQEGSFLIRLATTSFSTRNQLHGASYALSVILYLTKEVDDRVEIFLIRDRNNLPSYISKSTLRNKIIRLIQADYVLCSELNNFLLLEIILH